MTEEQRRRLRAVKTFAQLIAFLRDELDWPIDQGHEEEDLTFDWSEDLGLKENERVSIAPLIEPFRFFQKSRIKERGAIRFEHCINNDYVKFWGFALSLMNKTSLAIVSLITSNTFLDGKSFRA